MVANNAFMIKEMIEKVEKETEKEVRYAIDAGLYFSMLIVELI